MRTSAGFYGLSLLLLLLLLVSSTQAQSRNGNRVASSPADEVRCVRVTTTNPPEINLGKPATFVIRVKNDSRIPATGVVVSTKIPDHVELTKTDPKPILVEDSIHTFKIGDLGPGQACDVMLTVVPRSIDPVRLNSTVIFATSTRSLLLVRRPQLDLVAQAPAKVLIGERIEWSVRVVNSGDGPADDIVVTPNVVSGQLQGNSLVRPVRVGTLKAGESKEIKFTAIPSQRGQVSASFVASNPDGLDASGNASLQVLQAQLAVRTVGPRVQPLGRDGAYEIRVTNPGDAPTETTLVTAKVPAGLEITSAAENAYDEESRTLRWRITKVRPNDDVPLRFRAETIDAGNQTLSIVARSERIPEAVATHTTTVISRPNLIVTVVNDQELSAVGEKIGFRVTVVNAGSLLADNVRIRVAIPDEMEAVAASDYEVSGGQIEFAGQKLASGEKTTLTFSAIGRSDGQHRVRVIVGSPALPQELAFEGSAFCCSDKEAPAGRTALTGSHPRLPSLRAQRH